MVGPLGLGSSYGAPAKAYEFAFEKGCNYFYWGSLRNPGMAEAIRTLTPQYRSHMVIALQSYDRLGFWIHHSLPDGLKKLKIDYADVLLLGWYNTPPNERVLSAAMKFKEKGLVRKIAVSCHHRPTFKTYINDPRYDIIMLRYNAAHRGAEREVFPDLAGPAARPGVVAYTATRWGYLINPDFTPPGMKTPTAADCYRFSLSHPAVDLCLTGPKYEEEMQANLRALEMGPLSPEEMDWIKAVGDHVHQLTAKKIWTVPFMQRTQ